MKHLKLFVPLVILLITLSPILQSPVSAQAQKPKEVDMDVSPRGGGWDVTVTWHIKAVSIPEINYSGLGSNWEVTARYPQPYIDFYKVMVNNEKCGGGINPVTGQYRYPNDGYAFVIVIFPPGTSNTIGTLARLSDDCGQDGGTNFIGNPVVTPEDYASIVGSIWTSIDLPLLEIRMNPNLGVVTLPAWCWLQFQSSGEWWTGTDPNQGGAPFGATITIPLPTQVHRVEVLADATFLYWDFGDHSDSRFKWTTSVGKPYPKVSPIQHPYNNAITYFPRVWIHYVPRYAWNGGSFTALPDLYRESEWEKPGGYRVRELQVILEDPGPWQECQPEEYGITCGKGGNP